MEVILEYEKTMLPGYIHPLSRGGWLGIQALVMLNYYAPLDSKSPFKTLCFFYIYIYIKVLGEIQGLTFLINRNPMEDFERELIS
jgi:hypothetical protein